MPKATRGQIDAARAVVLERDQNTCQRCGINVLHRPASVQHRIPRGAGGSAKVWQPSNLALVCGSATTPDSCHNWMEHEGRAQAEVEGWLLPKLNAGIDTEQERLLTIHGWITLDNQGGRHSYPLGGGDRVTDKPLMLDLFCCAGGAAVGYARAGHKVVGFDKNPQPNYPYEFHQVDLVDPETGELKLPADQLDRPWVFGHGSPPCQSYSDLAHRNGNADQWPRLIEPTRRLFQRMGIPYVIENVSGAEVDMIDPVTLCGTMFPGLRVLRHRLFETNWDLTAPPHGKHPLVFTHDKRKAHYGRLDQDTSFVQVTGGGNCSIANARDAMGIDWMTKAELNEALPPAFTEYIGRQLISQLAEVAA